MDQLRKDIENQTNKFLKSGGKITEVPYGDSADDMVNASKGKKKLSKAKLAMMRGSKYFVEE